MVISVDATRQYTVPTYRGGAPAVVLAILMHVLLGLFLFFGLNWQSHAPVAIEAEMWSALPQIAAPAPTAPPVPVPQPVEQPQPIPVVPPQEVPPPPAPPEIAIKEPKKVPPKPAPPPPPPPPPAPAPPKPIPKPPPAPPPPPRAAPSDNLLQSMLADGAKPSTGKETKTSGPPGNPGYADKIGALIRNHTSFNGSGNPVVVVTIQLLPSGEVRAGGAQVKESSGNDAFDQAVIRGVYATSPFPKDTNGTVPPTMEVKYHLSPN